MLGKEIRHNREALHMRQKDLAKACHVSQQTIVHWEKGKKYPQADRLKEISNALDISVETLLCNNDDNMKYWIPIDQTEWLKSEIASLEEKCKSPDCSYFDHVSLALSKATLEGDSPYTGEPGKYILHLIVNEFEYNVWKALKSLDPDYDVNQFAELVQKAALRKIKDSL